MGPDGAQLPLVPASPLLCMASPHASLAPGSSMATMLPLAGAAARPQQQQQLAAAAGDTAAAPLSGRASLAAAVAGFLPALTTGP